MKNKKRRLLIVTGIVQLLIFAAFFGLMTFLTIYHGLPAWVHLPNALLLLASLSTLVAVAYGASSYVCMKCGVHICPSFWNWAVSLRFGFRRKLICPQCKERRWCRNTAFMKEEE